MMQKVLQTVVVFLLAALPVFAQEPTASLSDVRKAYEAFEYERVISISEQLLASPDTLSGSSRIALYTLNGVAHFIMGEEIQSEKSFIEVFKIESNFTLDSILYSPKIVGFVDRVKKGLPQTAAIKQASDNRKVPVESTLVSYRHIFSRSFGGVVARSLVLPGWGHLTIESSTKGWLLTAAAAIAVSSSVYYVIRTNKLEREYLNETDRQNIAAKYEDYNSAYKTRNIALGAYAVVWTVAQLDLLFFSHDEISASFSVTYQNTFPSDPTPYPSLLISLTF
jgi:hypothetical protein